jgi:hypothetical protein
MKLKFLASVVMASSTILASPIVGATVITPVAVEASSTFTNSEFNENNLINGVGLEDEFHDTYYGDMWLTNKTVTATLTFDLGNVYALSGAYVWQYNPVEGGTNSGVRQFNILTSTDGSIFNLVRSATLDQGSGVDGWFMPEFKAFNQTAQYVRFSILSNYGSIYSGLSEVRFESGLPVPEPRVTGLLALSVLSLFTLRSKNRFSRGSEELGQSS